MAASPYRQTSFNDKSLTVDKLNQLANNDQWLFENSPRMRYNYLNTVVRDNGLKIIAGKTPWGTTPGDALEVAVYFGSFFTASCRPIVNVTVETTGGWQRKYAIIRGLGGEVDYRGFIAHMATHERWVANNIEAPGWFHWTAVGF